MNILPASPSPYFHSPRPKKYLANRKAMLTREKMMKKVDKDFYPKHDSSKNVKPIFEIKNPGLVKTIEVIPWAACLALFIIVVF